MILARPEWGAVPPRGEFAPADRDRIQFLTVHRDLELDANADHLACAPAVRAAQLRDQDGGLVDLAWNVVACPHGQLYDVRSHWMAAETRMPEVDRVSLAIAYLGPTITDEGMAAVRSYWTFLQPLFPGIRIATHEGWDPGSDCPGHGIVVRVGEWVEGTGG